MTIKEKRTVINWMLDQLEAMEIANKKPMVGEYKLDQCWAIGSDVICFGESGGKQTIDVIAEALGEQPKVIRNYREVKFLGATFSQIIMNKEATDEDPAE